jgi:hypothetical protein
MDGAVFNLCHIVFQAWFSLSLMVRQDSAVISNGIHGSVRIQDLAEQVYCYYYFLYEKYSLEFRSKIGQAGWR